MSTISLGIRDADRIIQLPDHEPFSHPESLLINGITVWTDELTEGQIEELLEKVHVHIDLDGHQLVKAPVRMFPSAAKTAFVPERWWNIKNLALPKGCKLTLKYWVDGELKSGVKLETPFIGVCLSATKLEVPEGGFKKWPSTN